MDGGTARCGEGAGPGLARHPQDAGFTLVESVVAMAVFAVAAAVTLGLLLQTGQVTAGNVRRTAAANLAARQIESARSLSALQIPDGLVVSTRSVGGTLYTIRQSAGYLAPDSAGSVCSGSGSALAYKLITVSVTWPGMGSLKPVRVDTLKAVGVGTGGLDQTSLGTLALLVTGSTGAPQPGVTVTLTPGGDSQVTGDDGCAVFAGQDPGSYTVTASMPGYTGVANTRTATAGGLGVSAAAITRGTLTYDSTRSVDVRLDGAVGGYLPAGLTVRLGDVYLPERGYPLCTGASVDACTSGTPGVVQGLFPEVYAVKVGACAEPTPSQVTVDLRPDGQPTPVALVPVGTVTVDVRTAAGGSLAGRTVTATHAAGCSETFTLPSTTAGGTGLVLPYGTWTLSTPQSPLSALAVTATVTVGPAARTPSVQLTVAS